MIETVLSHEIPAKSSFAWELKAGDELRITDLEGQQVGDLVLFDAANTRDKLSISWTRTRNVRDTSAWVPSFGLTVGDRIFSTGYKVLAVVTEDTPQKKGVHDLNGRMCNRAMYELYGAEPQDGCFELLSRAIAEFSIAPEEIPDAIGVFMHTVPEPETRRWSIQAPVSRSGDRFSIRAETALIAAMSTCPMDVIAPTNGWRITPMLIEVHRTS